MRSNSKIIKDSGCPSCQSIGNDSTSNHLIHFDNEWKYCNRCDYTEAPDGTITKAGFLEVEVGTFIGEQEEEDLYWNDYTPQQIKETLPFGNDPGRKISKEVLKKVGVRAEYDEQGKVDKVFYPYYDGKELGYKTRKHFEKGDREIKNKPELLGKFKCFRAVGKVTGSLFNQYRVPRGSKRVLIVEGEEDQLAAEEMLQKYNPKVLSIPSGATIDKDGKGILDKAILENIDYLNSMKELVICFDQDAAGKAITKELGKLLGPKAKVMYISLKDASDMLTRGKQEEFISAFFDAKEYTPEEIKFGEDISVEELMKPIEPGTMLSMYPILSRKLRGFRPAELTILLAPTKSGKSSICREAGYGFIDQGEYLGNLFLEEEMKKTIQAYIAIDNEVRLPEFRANPEILTVEQVTASRDRLLSRDKAVFLEANKLSPESVMKNMRYMHSLGSTKIILDHLSYVFSGTKTNDERKDIDLLLHEIAAFVKETRVHVILVAHIKRKDFQPKKDKEGDIIYPYWIPVNKEDGRGTAAFEQLCHNLIVIEPEMVADGQGGKRRGRIRLNIEANREWDDCGAADVLIMDAVTGRMVNAESEITF